MLRRRAAEGRLQVAGRSVASLEIDQDGNGVSERLGHATVGLMRDTCSHVLPDVQRDAAEVTNGALTAALRWSVKGAA